MKSASTASRVRAVIERRFPNSAKAPIHYGELLVEYIESGFAPPTTLSELETGDDGKFWSCVWEAMLYRHLQSQNLAMASTSTGAGQKGPDFCIDYNGQRVWIEAIVPAPEGIPVEWLAPPGKAFQVRTMPHEAMLLRCTSAIAAKRDQFGRYRKAGIVGLNDCTVIAVNTCRLSSDGMHANGISQLPLVVEAVFPVGPLGVPISRQGKVLGPAEHTARFTVAKTNNVATPTYAFLDDRFAGVSAVVQGHQRDLYMSPLILATVHNPNATTPLPLGLLRPSSEYVATASAADYELRNIQSGG